MRNIFRRSTEFTKKHRHHHHLFLAVLALVVAGTGVYTFRHEIARAATYTFTQTSWSTATPANSGACTSINGTWDAGASECRATHASNQASWPTYTSASTTISIGANDISLLSASYSFTDDGSTTTDSPGAIGGGFSSGTYSATIATTTASGASVGLIGTSANTWSTMATTPLATGYGGSLVYPGSGDYIYGYRGGNTTTFYRYSISGNSWTAMATTPAAIATGPTYTGTILTYPGSGDFIYGYRGNSTAFYRYSITDNTWTSMAPALAAITAGNALTSAGGDIYGAQGSTLYKYSVAGNSWTSLGAISGGNTYGGSLMYPGSGDYIYALVSTAPRLRRYSISGGTWSNLTTPPDVVSHGATLVYPGSGDYIYTYQGATNAFYRYSITGNSWTTMAVVPGATTAGGSLVYPGSGNYIYGFQGSSNAFYRYSIADYYNSPGTFTSNTIDFARSTIFTNMTVASTTPSGTSVSIKVRSSADGSTWADWDVGGCTATTAGTFTMSSLGCVTNGHRYIQYQATLSNTGDTTNTPTLDSVIINDTQFSADGGILTSSKYDAGDDTNLISRLTWAGTATSSTEVIKFQVRSASSSVLLDSATWCGPTVCDGAEYFLYTNNGVDLPSNHPLRSGANDRWVQYRVILASGGAVSPVLESVDVRYVVNAAPTFDSGYGTNGIIVSQVTDSASADFGKVTISYRIRDTDTNCNGVTPCQNTTQGLVTPSFEYNSGAGWANITTNLSAGATDPKAVEEVNYNTYTATWTASSTVTANTATAQVRVKIDDSEGANRYGTATSGNFTLDTTVPVISTATLDSSTGGSAVGTIALTTTDTNTIQYRICNDSVFPSSDAQGNSCAWTTLASSPVTASPSWVPTGSPSDEVVYMQARDLYNNITSRTIVAPAMPSNFGYTDASNVGIDVYREFLSWSPFVATTSSTFNSYKVYHSTDGVTYGSPLTTITDSAVNYYVHNITTATSSTHYYKVLATNTEGSVSNFTGAQSDIPDGSGGLDTTAPYIPLAGIATSSVGNSSANITFSTYTDSSMATGELATSTVYYGTYSGSVPGTCPASRVDTTSYVVNHSVYLTGLTSGTDYYYCVTAKDMTGNTSTASPVSAGGVFTTVSGPRITNVTQREITDTSALIFWNTDTSSNSTVCYSTTTSGANSCATSETGAVVTTSGTNANGTFYQHQVGLTGLTPGYTYYYKVSSTDTAPTPLTSTDNNNGQYYSFVTLTDTSPPVISATSTPVLAPDSAVVVWQTNEPASTKVEYGLTSSYGTISEDVSAPLSIYHVRALTSLTKENTYFYRVTSKDAANNTATADGTFYTPADGNVVISVSVRAGDTKDTTPPVVSSVVVSDITPFGAVVKFSTDEDTDGFVKYGKDTTYGDAAGDEVWSKNHTIKLRGLTLGTDYHIKVTANDKAGNTGSSADQIFKTTFLSENLKDMANIENIEQFQKEIESAIESILPSLVPPFITKPIISDITEGGAKISFKSNIKAFPVVVYAEDGAYDETKENPYTGEVSDTTEKATSHEIALTGLKGNTKYHVQARGFSLPKVIGKSADVTFITKASKIAGSIVERKKDSFTVVWTTDQPTTTIVEYKDLKRGITGRKTDDAKKTSHSMKIENLPSGTAYEVNLSGMTEQGNIAEAGSPLSVTTSTDTTSPTISGFKVDNALVPGRTDRIQTIVSWVTDEPSTSTAFYEEGAGTPGDTEELASKNEILDSYVLNHSVILPSLKPGTIYRLKVTSTDDSGNEGSFGPRTVITPKQTESITDIIFKNFEDSFKFLQKI